MAWAYLGGMSGFIAVFGAAADLGLGVWTIGSEFFGEIPLHFVSFSPFAW